MNGRATTAVLTTVAIASEQDVVLARQRGRQAAALLGLDRQDQARVATAVSELARNAYEYAGGGKVEYLIGGEGGQAELLARVSDSGGGIADLDAVLEGRYRSPTGMGLGIVGARRLMDRFEIRSTAAEGTEIVIGKPLRRPRPSKSELGQIADALAREMLPGAAGELQLQNQELMRTLAELEARQEELARLNRELEETNRGVVALYAELDTRAEELREASETKSRFLSSISHELRTPLSSLLALSELLLAHADGPLTGEQERQVGYIQEGAQTLLALVNELLDLARIEAGKTEVQPAWFEVADLFGSLRGMFRPLHRNEQVALLFEPAEGLRSLHSDEAKLAMVLRNLISNALKFTQQGEVRISATLTGDAREIRFAVADTGIGISESDQQRVFEEFTQIDSPLQRQTRGSGLGLTVARRLSELLGGSLTLTSSAGGGSTFTATIPVVYIPGDDGAPSPTSPAGPRRELLSGLRVLIVDDEEAARYVARRALTAHGCSVLEAATIQAGLSAAREQRPDVVVLDLKMPGGDGDMLLRDLRRLPETSLIPVIIHTAKHLDPDERARLAEDADMILDKNESTGDELVATVAHASAREQSR